MGALQPVGDTRTVMPELLIADDSPNIRSLLLKLLARPGLRTCEAVDGLDAIEKARHQKPDVVILDIFMPRMNGLAAAHVLKTEMPNVPVILLSMYADAVTPSQAAEAGVAEIVSKNNVTHLITCIDRALAATRFAKLSKPPTTD
jgi:CheY-like chemotaxis protein